MLRIEIPSIELFDDETSTFVNTKSAELQLEHSLVSLSKWESKWHKPYLSSKKTQEEALDYVRCMTITQNVDPEVYKYIPSVTWRQIEKYINDPMTATKISKRGTGGSVGRVVTSELIYYWMTYYNIPIECQKWHLNRLLTLINVCTVESKPKEKMSKKDIYAQNRLLNEQRKAKLHTKG